MVVIYAMIPENDVAWKLCTKLILEAPQIHFLKMAAKKTFYSKYNAFSYALVLSDF